MEPDEGRLVSHGYAQREERGNGDDEYESIYTESVVDTLDDFFERYTIDFAPEWRLKFKRRWKDLVVSASVGLNGAPVILSLKPQQEGGWWRKLSLTPHEQGVSLYSRRFRIANLLDLQLEAHSTARARLGVSWRLFPKWSRPGTSKLVYKYKHDVGEAAQARLHLDCDMGWPELGGELGAGSHGPALEYEQGYCHIDVPRIELVMDLDKTGGRGGCCGRQQHSGGGSTGSGGDAFGSTPLSEGEEA